MAGANRARCSQMGDPIDFVRTPVVYEDLAEGAEVRVMRHGREHPATVRSVHPDLRSVLVEVANPRAFWLVQFSTVVEVVTPQPEVPEDRRD